MTWKKIISRDKNLLDVAHDIKNEKSMISRRWRIRSKIVKIKDLSCGCSEYTLVLLFRVLQQVHHAPTFRRPSFVHVYLLACSSVYNREKIYEYFIFARTARTCEFHSKKTRSLTLSSSRLNEMFVLVSLNLLHATAVQELPFDEHNLLSRKSTCATRTTCNLYHNRTLTQTFPRTASSRRLIGEWLTAKRHVIRCPSFFLESHRNTWKFT